VSRGYAPVAVVLLLAVTVLAAGAVAASLPGLPGEPPPHRGISAEATSDGRVDVTLVSGDPIDVQQASVRLTVDGDDVRHQPPVPFFAARGFRGGPTGPFNLAADPTWTVGELAGFRLAHTNDPPLRRGDTVTVRVVVDGQIVAETSTTVGSDT